MHDVSGTFSACDSAVWRRIEKVAARPPAMGSGGESYRAYYGQIGRTKANENANAGAQFLHPTNDNFLI